MSKQFVITGTDTDVGKTVVSAMLTLALEAFYWKPVQSGVHGGVDTKTVQRLTGLPAGRFLEERYIFTEALSPHRAAELDETEIEIEELRIPDAQGPLIIEGAGGLMVPLTRRNLQINLYKKWQVPVILVARTELGTINHTLLSLEALLSRDIPVHGIIFNGPDNPDNIQTIQEFADVNVLGRIPKLDSLTSNSLTRAFEDNFVISDFL